MAPFIWQNLAIDAQQKAHIATTITVGANGQAGFRLATAKDQHVAIGADKGLENASLFVGGAALRQRARLCRYSTPLQHLGGMSPEAFERASL